MMGEAWTEIDVDGSYTLVSDGERRKLPADLTAEQIKSAQWEFFGPDLMAQMGNVPAPKGLFARVLRRALILWPFGKEL